MDKIWDTLSKEYGLNGDYWKGSIRLLLTELHSGGLLESTEQTIDEEGTYFGAGKVLYKYALGDFGRMRAEQVSML